MPPPVCPRGPARLRLGLAVTSPRLVSLRHSATHTIQGHYDKFDDQRNNRNPETTLARLNPSQPILARLASRRRRAPSIPHTHIPKTTNDDGSNYDGRTSLHTQ
jgi:hypothetical protein